MSFLRAVAASAILAVSSIAATAQTANAALSATLLDKINQINRAFEKGDPTPIRDIISDSAVITNPAGGFVGREDLFALITSGTLKYTSNRLSDAKLTQYGDMAILTYLADDVGTIGGHDISGKSRWTQVWVKQAGQWKIVATQGTNVAPPM